MSADHEEAPKRRGGRPPSRKRGTFSFRVTADLREKLEAAAATSGRPVSEEIELRLGRSFDDPAIAQEAAEQASTIVANKMMEVWVGGAGGYEYFMTMQSLGFAMRKAREMTEDHLKQPWYMTDEGVEFFNKAMMKLWGEPKDYRQLAFDLRISAQNNLNTHERLERERRYIGKAYSEITNQPGDSGTISCPQCGGSLHWTRNPEAGTISGQCEKFMCVGWKDL